MGFRRCQRGQELVGVLLIMLMSQGETWIRIWVSTECLRLYVLRLGSLAGLGEHSRMLYLELQTHSTQLSSQPSFSSTVTSKISKRTKCKYGAVFDRYPHLERTLAEVSCRGTL
ncbi:hypothetical protein B0T19DRAFT_18686 [Cercophora scortea]|uniref:Uncharacterized protein n=1 Tax=Cercophora scortea TaxID=314031 RepID=A0AAE0J2P6_9PEZI|nr:hypothetical protein B0T19DRAFT_18686 [Cercophora scortea]